MFFKKDKKVKSILEIAIKEIGPAIAEYSEWYDQNGLYLPPDYETNPSGWCEDLHKIVNAFEYLEDGRHLTKDEQAAVKEGFEIFGKQLVFLTDVIKPLRPAH